MPADRSFAQSRLARRSGLTLMLMASTFAPVAAASHPSEQPASREPVKKSQQGSRPNIVIVVLDDVGFAASAAFGGAIGTPALEKLARSGITYNRFHTTSVCSPTRAALLTGRNAHRVAAGGVIEFPHPGYNWSWPKNSATVAQVLQDEGYATAAFGKWHNTPSAEVSPMGPFDRWPTGLGFQHFYGFMQGQDSQWEPLLYKDTTAIDPPASAGKTYHFSEDIADQAIRWVQTRDTIAADKPYFLYFATGGAHAPHHVAPEWIAKYRGRFDQGWDRLREEIFARQKKMGIIPANAELTPRPDALPAWDSLSADQKRLYARQMEIFAGYLEHTDHEVGRVLDAVRAAPDGDNTMILYVVGDNGGSGEGAVDGSDVGLANIIYRLPSTVEEQLSHVDRFGTRDYDNHFSAAWAWATTTPFHWMKRVASSFGGTRNPLVISWPAHIRSKGEVRSQFTAVNDIVPTIYEAAGIAPPRAVEGVEQTRFDGISFAYSFDAAAAPSRHRIQYFEETGNRAIYQDGWMATARRSLPWELTCKPDFSKDKWELYNIDRDFTQARDLADQYPERLKALQALFDREAKANQVYPMQDGCIVKTAGSQVVSTDKTEQKPAAPAQEIIYHSGIERLPVAKAPDFLRSHSITTRIEPGKGPVEGVIVTNGSRYGGFTLYVKNGRLTYESNFFGKQRTVLDAPLPKEAATISYRYTRENTAMFGGGTGQLLVNGKVVAQRRFDRVGPPAQFGSLGVGRSHGGAVSNAYDGAFRFTGQMDAVKVSFP